MKVHYSSILPLRTDAEYGSVRSGGSICVSSLLKPIQLLRRGNEFILIDAKSGLNLVANLHFDAIGDDEVFEDGTVYALNYYMTESELIRQNAADMYNAGILLLRVRANYYRRVGIYDTRDFTDWFTNSTYETINLI
jgi:hypothetical protein